MIDARLTDGSQDIVIGTRNGLAVRFHEKEARPMGRAAGGVRAIRLGKGDKAVGAVALRRSGTTILIATEKGYGKRSETTEYRVSHRGGKGIITVKTTDKTGPMVAIKEVVESDDIVIVTVNGIVIRQHASEIRIAGRNTQGVRLIRLDSGDAISDVAAVASEEGESEEPAPPRPKGPASEEPGKTEPQDRAVAGKGEAKGGTAKPKSEGRTATVKSARPGKRRKRR